MNRWPRELLMLERPFTDEEAERNRWQTADMHEHHMQRALWWRHRSSALAMVPNYTPDGWEECDLYLVTGRGYAAEYEIKRTRSDFKADFRKRHKHQMLRGRTGRSLPTRFTYVCPAMVIPLRDVPDYAGLMYAVWTGSNPASRWTTPMLHEIRPAPRLRETKVPRERVQQMRRTTYHRFWNERFTFEDYRARVEREKASAQQ